MLIDIVKTHNQKNRKVVIYTSYKDKRIDDFIKYIHHFDNQIIGYYREEKIFINLVDIFNFYTSDKKVYATTSDGNYQIKMRMYELEEFLDYYFIRVSNTDIVNTYHIQSFKREGIKTVCVVLKSGCKIYVSRRYWPSVKKRMEDLAHEKTKD